MVAPKRVAKFTLYAKDFDSFIYFLGMLTYIRIGGQQTTGAFSLEFYVDLANPYEVRKLKETVIANAEGRLAPIEANEWVGSMDRIVETATSGMSRLEILDEKPEIITYVGPTKDEATGKYSPDNLMEVVSFIGPHYRVCTICDGSGEYENDYGVQGCNECSSRLIPFTDVDGKHATVDWGQRIMRTKAGIVLLDD